MHTRRNAGVGALAALFVIVSSTLLLLARPAAAEPKRPKQRYGGPEEGKTSALEVVEWVPRVALFPLWAVSEFGVRRPLGAFLKFVEEKQVVLGLMAVLTFGERRQISIFPSALFDFGLLPSVGFNAGWQHFLAETNTASLHFGTWGADWISIRATDEYELAKGRTLSFDTSLVRRQDNPFFGMGPRSPADGRVRYQSTGLEMAVGYQQDLWRSSSFQARAGARSLTFGDGTCCGQPALMTPSRPAGRLPPASTTATAPGSRGSRSP